MLGGWIGVGCLGGGCVFLFIVTFSFLLELETGTSQSFYHLVKPQGLSFQLLHNHSVHFLFN